MAIITILILLYGQVWQFIADCSFGSKAKVRKIKQIANLKRLRALEM